MTQSLPMLLAFLVALAVVFSVLPAALFVANLRLFREPFAERPRQPPEPGAVSVLIPARDEEANIAACLNSVLASTAIALEVLVLDDASTDRTADIVRAITFRDPRVQLLTASALPSGWNGKQHACWLLAQQARHGLLLFLDADLRLAPDAIDRCVTTLCRSGVPLLSGFPRQITKGPLEKLLLPLIHFVLLSFLPLSRMRRSALPAYAAGCGQFMLVERAPYFACGGHQAIRETRHDGLRLPQLFRQHGFRTDIADLTHLAAVRMYTSTAEVWQGLAKNATEGLGSPARIVPFTIMLLLGQVLPLLLALTMALLWLYRLVIGVGLFYNGSPVAPVLIVAVTGATALALLASYLPRLIAVRRFREPLLSALLHPLGILVLLAIQWYALIRQLLGRPVGWRSRTYSTTTGTEVT